MTTSPQNIPLISCIIPCKGAATLRATLESLEKQDLTEPYEVIVVDGWWDDEVSKLAGEFSKVRLVRSRDNLLPGAARTLGAQCAGGEFLAFLDSDCVAEPGFLSAAVAALRSGARLAGGPVLDLLPYHPIAAADNLAQFADLPPTRPDGEANRFPGCNQAIRKADLVAMGGYPSATPVHEDGMLCVNVEARWPEGVRFFRSMRVRHRGRTSWGAYLRHQSLFGFYRGKLGFDVTPLHRKMGRWQLMIPAVAAARLLYITRRTLQFNPLGAFRLLALSPILTIGLVAWAYGFRRACLEADLKS